MTTRRPVIFSLIALVVLVGSAIAEQPGARSSATCADYRTQAEAQREADTVDADGDGVYCEALPCPCLGATDERSAGLGRGEQSCERARRTVEVGISSTRYPAVLAHIETAVTAGWPRVLKINRRGAEQRRQRALRGWPTKPGYDRDEWPMAMARRSWRTHVAYVPSAQNRGAGATIGVKLRRFCDGVRFTVVGY
ncbi:NucA/NucB deoxyribonuclease domain-containing protein [Conexibacter sp. JD483]|uniref:NucA/NucB deoxyribonuclease domain-containing protein n=1 Tax=unclassified Conexibacter TaxID=2627773 RepID=UPI0027224A53|nr:MULTISPECIES: NucA/NucB deoxyribonuclease domain-containing protein [unclassified Conexibacter]MDO8184641.1 NucA/NucB deoxyribonuclease domain-containing protein [Conexibacter sp. CPCC 205706]MDO8197947.1 NucA/NucB deoxyribonuclease domain-containing protein [Conexibacter sp. CPCC 205762]MDR9368377.1 NucA/NucB deoxyribonuclease domain-containing protein [Conexibacter sp. JD483]